MCNKCVIGEWEGHLNIQFKYWTFISDYLKTLFVYQRVTCSYLSRFSTSVTSSSTVSLASSASELHTVRLLITFSRRYPTIHWAPSVSAPNAVLRGMLIWGRVEKDELDRRRLPALWPLLEKNTNWCKNVYYSDSVEKIWLMKRSVSSALYLPIELLVHEQIRLSPSSEEPHDVLPHLRAQKLRQIRSGCPGLHFWCPQHRWQQPEGKGSWI